MNSIAWMIVGSRLDDDCERVTWPYRVFLDMDEAYRFCWDLERWIEAARKKYYASRSAPIQQRLVRAADKIDTRMWITDTAYEVIEIPLGTIELP